MNIKCQCGCEIEIPMSLKTEMYMDAYKEGIKYATAEINKRLQSLMEIIDLDLMTETHFSGL